MMRNDTDAGLNFDELLKTVERSGSRKNSSDKDALPEHLLRKTWEEEVHRLWKNRYENDTRARMILAYTTQGLIYGWMICVVIILMCNSCFGLSDNVLMVLLGTTTTTVIGLALVVLKGFFQFMKQDVDLRDRNSGT